MFATYVTSASEKNGLDFSRDGQESGLTARDAIYDLLGQLCEELSGSRTLVEGNPFSEFAFYRPRALLIYALMAVYWMWSEAEGWKRPKHKAVVEKIVPENLPTQWLWAKPSFHTSSPIFGTESGSRHHLHTTR